MNTSARLACVGILLLAGATAPAQTAREGGGANAQLLQQLQQLASERAQLQAENARLDKELDDAKKKLAALATDNEALDRQARSSAAALSRSALNADNLEQSLAQQRARMDELIAKFRETATTLRDVETDRSQISERLAARERAFQTCAERNLALHQINAEVLDRLERQGFWASLGKAEPFTRLKRAEIDNLIEDYRNRADDQRIDSAAASTPPGG
jgi:chromosome segregation ATPase